MSVNKMVCRIIHKVHVVGGMVADFLEVLATQAISNVIKSSFGPSGLDKMMVDDIGV